MKGKSILQNWLAFWACSLVIAVIMVLLKEMFRTNTFASGEGIALTPKNILFLALLGGSVAFISLQVAKIYDQADQMSGYFLFGTLGGGIATGVVLLALSYAIYGMDVSGNIHQIVTRIGRFFFFRCLIAGLAEAVLGLVLGREILAHGPIPTSLKIRPSEKTET